MIRRICTQTVITFFLILLWNLSFSQDHGYIDSLVQELPNSDDTTKAKIYLGLLSEYSYHSEDTVCLYAKLMYKVAKKDKSSRVYPLALNALGFCHSSTSEYDSSLYYYHQALDFHRMSDNKLQIARALNNISSPLYSQGKLEESLDYVLQSVRITEEIGNTGEVLAANYWNIGNLVYEMDSLSESNEWYNKASKLYKELGKIDHYMDLENLKALNYKDMDSLDLAIRLFKKCENYYRENNQTTELATTLDYLGVVYMKLKKWKQAEECYLEALPLAEESGEKRMAGYSYQKLTLLYLDTGRLKLAEKYGKKSLANAQELGLNDKILIDNEYLSKIYEKQGKPQLALDHYKVFLALKDSINNVAQKGALAELKIKYETEKNEQEIKLLQEKEKRNSLEKKGMIGGIIGLIGLFCALLYAIRQRMIKNKFEKEKLDQELTFSNKELEFNRKELALRKQELTAYALQLASKNAVLEEIKSNVVEAKSVQDNNRSLQSVINKIDYNQNDDESWEGFRTRFQAIHIDFESKIKDSFPKVSTNEMRLMALLRMNLSSKEIANILNISGEGIKKARYRLRKKLDLETSASLEELILSI